MVVMKRFFSYDGDWFWHDTAERHLRCEIAAALDAEAAKEGK